ncbi:MAG: hypothetical protein HC880_20240 [Bacteroidia bacterium]|nr:hypothetical protein [Bacteroidia bacterium]
MIIGLIFFSFSLNYAQSNVDSGITASLNQLNFKYDIKEDGTFQFTIPVGSRSQMIFIHSTTSSYDKMNIREIYSVIYQSPQMPDEVVLRKLLVDNAQKKLGAWEVIFEDNTSFIVFTAKVPANLDASDLKSTVEIVATSADTMEQILYNTDEW